MDHGSPPRREWIILVLSLLCGNSTCCFFLGAPLVNNSSDSFFLTADKLQALPLGALYHIVPHILVRGQVKSQCVLTRLDGEVGALLEQGNGRISWFKGRKCLVSTRSATLFLSLASQTSSKGKFAWYEPCPSAMAWWSGV